MLLLLGLVVRVGPLGTDVDLPELGQLGRVRLLAVLADPVVVGVVGDLLVEDLGGLAVLEEGEEVAGDADVLLEGLLDVGGGAGGPAEKQGLEERGVGDAGVGGAEAGEEPGGTGAAEDGDGEVADGVEVGAAVEDAGAGGPGGGVHDEDGDGDVVVQGAAGLAGVEDDAADGRVGLGRGSFEGLESAGGAVGVAADGELGEVEAAGPGGEIGAFVVGVGGEEVGAVAVVETLQDADGLANLGVAEGQLIGVHADNVHGRVAGAGLELVELEGNDFSVVLGTGG